MPHAAVLGTGLIGASIGIGLRTSGWAVTGWDPDPGHLDGAEEVGAVDERAPGIAEAVEGADLVVLAGPISATIDTLARLDADQLVIDVAGVKGPVLAAGAHLRRFVPTHPMAGSETSGPQAASGSLFRGASWVVVTDRAAREDIDAISAIVEALGAVAIPMTAEEHDVSVALASHLPHVTAGALVDIVGGHPGALALAAGGFRDLTRVAASTAGWWADVLVANASAVSEAIDALTDRLHVLGRLVEEGAADLLAERLTASADRRRALSAPVASVRLVLEDRPGQMALVGAALSASGVDLRDLQLRHATHGGGGVLTLSVRPDEADRLAGALQTQGFQLLD